MESQPSCLNLKKLFGKKYFVKYEESYWVQRSVARTVDPWLMIIPCKYGHIYPHGGDQLAASVDGHGGIARRLSRTPGLKVQQDGTDGMTLLFGVDLFPQIAKVMHPRKRRQLSAEQKQAMADRMLAVRARVKADPQSKESLGAS